MSPQIDYPEIAEGIMPRHRFMSAYEQRIEPPDRRWQYLLMAAEPYETIAFKVVQAGSTDPRGQATRLECPSSHSRVPHLGPWLWQAGEGHPEVPGAPSRKKPSFPGWSGTT